jgi:hypothetical protein
MEIKIDVKRELKSQLVRVYDAEELKYAEEDIPDRSERDFFRGYKWAMDDVLQMIDCWIENGGSVSFTEQGLERLKQRLYTNTAKTLMRILDSDGKMG